MNKDDFVYFGPCQKKMTNTTLFVFVVGYLMITVFIGYLASKRVKNSSDFVLAGRNLPMFFNATALFALWFGSETVFGASSEFMKHGLSGVIEDPFGGVLALLLFGLFFVRKLYRLNILTLNDLLRDKYGKTVELVSGFCMVFSFFGYIAAQLVALTIILCTIVPDLPFPVGLIICSLLVTFYTFVGGMWAVSITDFVQSIIIIIGLIALAIYFTMEAGGLHGLQQKWQANPDQSFRFFPEGGTLNWVNWFSAWMVLGLGSLCSQDIFQRANSARSEKAAVNSTYLGAFLYLLVAALPLYIGFVVKYQYLGSASITEETDMQLSLPTVVMQYTPLWLQILFFGSLLSAVMSTASGAILAPASILSENIIKPLTRNKLSDSDFLWILRLSVVVMAGLSTVLAFFNEDIYELVASSSIIGMVSLLVPVTCALYWPKANRLGAMLSMVLGFTGWVLFEYVIKPEFYAFLPALFLSILGMFLGSVLWSNKKTELPNA